MATLKALRVLNQSERFQRQHVDDTRTSGGVDAEALAAELHVHGDYAPPKAAR